MRQLILPPKAAGDEEPPLIAGRPEGTLRSDQKAPPDGTATVGKIGALSSS